ncbi:MAG: PAS domain-containing protein [Ktedonobacteraceae bacterium]|nr:PAS domain-containing protein [Ktedonobacteraceae bacterium]
MDMLSEPLKQGTSDNTLAGGGEMGRLMREHDWSASPLGPVTHWPQSLRTAVSICLASRFPIVIFWGEQLRQFYNDAYRPILGKSKQPGALGQRSQECWSEIWDVIGPMLDGVLSTGVATWSENQLLLLDRNGYLEEAYFTFSYSPIRDEAGEVGGVFCAVTETTEEVISARRLRTLRTLGAHIAEVSSLEEVCSVTVRTLADNPADLPFTLLYLLDPDEKCARLVGTSGIPAYTTASPQSIALDEPSAPWPFAQGAQSGKPEQVDDLAAHFGTIAGLVSVGPTPHSALVLPISRAGQARPYGFMVAGINPRRVLDEDYRGFFSLVADQVATAIAAARAYQEACERANALAELDRAKTAFFSNVSHEFRTPLTLLLGPLETMLSDTEHPLTSSQRSSLEIVHRNGLRQLKLVNTLLDFSRIEAERMEAVYEPTDLASYTTDLASTFRSAVERAGMRLIVDCPPLPEPVYVDREMWEKIVLNLLSNAFKFTFEGEIRVSLAAVENTVQLSVMDTGIGIAAEHLPHLFERFYRVSKARARTYEGSGIGLSLVQELVRLHGGSIHVNSVVGSGTTFTVTIPQGFSHLPSDRLGGARSLISTVLGATPYVQEALRWLPENGHGSAEYAVVEETSTQGSPSLASPTTAFRSSGQQGRATAHILVVDDNADMRDYLKRLLSPFYILQLVADGTTALQVAQNWLPDLILADVMMPGLDGFALLAALHVDTRTNAIPVILLSARAGEEATIEGLKLGANDYLVKPFSAHELLARVEAQLEIAHLRREAANRTHRLEAIFEAMVDAVVVYDSTGRIVQANDAFQELLGIRMQPDYLTSPLAERMARVNIRDEHGSPLPEHAWPMKRILRGEVLKGTHVTDIIVRSIDGRTIQLSTSGAPLRDQEGSIVGGVAIYHDVTGRRHLEEERNQLLVREQAARAEAEVTRQHLHDLFMQAPAIIAVLRRPQHVFELANPRYFHLLGQRDLIGKPIREALPEVEGQGFFDLLDQVYTTGEPFIGNEMQLWLDRHQDGTREEGFFNFVYQPAHNAAGEVEGILVHAVEVTEQVHVRQRMDTFLGIASHELRSPLTSIKGNVQLANRRLTRALRDAAADSTTLRKTLTEVQVLLGRAERQVGVQNRLVSDLIDVSRIQAEKLELHMEACDLVSIVREAVEDQRLLAPTRNINLNLSDYEIMPLIADADRIGQVVTNYLSNALKYSEPHCPVAVTLQVKGTTACVSVRDAGQGLTPAEQERIWERFYRAPGVVVQSGSGVGLGLGLHICRTIIEQHQGQVGVESVKGQGSTFWFTLPLVPS